MDRRKKIAEYDKAERRRREQLLQLKKGMSPGEAISLKRSGDYSKLLLALQEDQDQESAPRSRTAAAGDECDLCTRLLTFSNWEILRFGGSPERYSWQYVRTWAALSKSAETGCPLCKCLVTITQPEGPSAVLRWQKNKELRCTCTYDPRVSCLTIGEEVTGSMVEFTVITDAGSTLSSFISGRSPEVDVKSARSYNSAKKWIKECDTQHTHTYCKRPLNTTLPKRVIDVEPNNTRLVHQGGVTAKYACLSYCWGQRASETTHQTPYRRQESIATTTKANIDQYSIHLPLEILPKTLRNAISVTRKLDIKYLWVDRLCIIQDDEIDREEQLECMGDIYSNAYLTISAASAKCCHDGFLHKRKHEDLIRLPCQSPSGDVGSVILYRHDKSITREPIYDRMWTLQEDLLSSRVLFYGDVELVWHCNCRSAQIGGVPADENARRRDLTKLRKGLSPFQQDVMKDRGRKMRDDYLRIWWETLVHECSRRRLTRFTDKTSVVGGIAARFGTIHQDEYIAGFWGRWLLRHLLWTTIDQKATVRHPEQWHAPSWSWLSVDGPVCLNYVPPDEQFRATCSIVGKNIIRKNQTNTYGKVDAASITIKGFLATIIPKRTEFSESYFCDQTAPAFVLDTPAPDFAFEDDLMLLTLGRRLADKYYSEGFFGLILKPLDLKSELYTRVGWFYDWDKELVQGLEYTVTII